MRRPTIVALLAALLFVGPVSAAEDTVTYETQAWWRKAGIVVPGAVGSHVHVKATVPRDGVIVDGSIAIPVTVTLHDAAGKTNWFRIGTEDDLLYQRDLALGPCADCSSSFTATVDLSSVPTGRHEIRMSANIPDEDTGLTGGQRFFPTFNAQVCVRSCSPSYRSDGIGKVFEGRSWYQGVNYQNASLRSAISTIKSGGLISIRTGPGSGGRTTKLSGVYIDPDFHNGSFGIKVREWSTAVKTSITLPTIAPGSHRLVIVSSDGQNAGVVAIPFVQN